MLAGLLLLPASALHFLRSRDNGSGIRRRLVIPSESNPTGAHQCLTPLEVE